MLRPRCLATSWAKHLGCSISTVHKLVRSGGLPHISLTDVTQRCVRFRMSQVDAWVATREKRYGIPHKEPTVR